jgi:2-hydroxychromene-2-carboxylate isomerase
LGGTFFYAGEWYWGIDRLYHLEQRLQDLGAQREGVAPGPMFPPGVDPNTAQPAAVRSFDFFLSLRSPYTAIVAQRVLDLAQHTGAQLNLRFLLPMAMRGLAVPRAKRMYIAWDTAREARSRGVPFGRLLDPLGVATERGLAVLAAAMQAGMGEAFLISFLRGVWSEGVNASTDAGLRRLALRAGLSWAQVQDALNDEGWRASAEANRQALLDHGLWGVPAFRVGTQVFWGQDRLWAVQQALLDERNAR